MKVTYDMKVIKLGALLGASILRIGCVQHGESFGEDEEYDGADECSAGEFNPGGNVEGSNSAGANLAGENALGANAASQLMDEPWDGFDFDDSEGIRE